MNRYDFVIMGGGIAGSLSALRILEARPDARILVCEASESFPQKIGESSSDITALALRRFGLDEQIDHYLYKNGLRFWFSQGHEESVEDCAEYSSPSLPSYLNGKQLDRAEFDQILLDKVQSLGVEVRRPEKVIDFSYAPYNSKVTTDAGEYEATWLIDCSGRRGLVANKMKWRHNRRDHNTAAMWAHFDAPFEWPHDQDVADTRWERSICERGTGTCHFMRKGYWIWYIPVSKNRLSIGLVIDKDIVPFSPAQAQQLFWETIESHKELSRMLPLEQRPKVNFYSHLPYTSDHIFQPGLALIGDAGSFVDPLFSPGIEMMTHQAYALEEILKCEDASPKQQKRVMKLDRHYRDFYESRFHLYRGRYKLMGQADLFGLMSQLDIYGYFTFVVAPAIHLRHFRVFPSKFNFLSAAIYDWIHRRVQRIAKRREKRGYTPAAVRTHSYFRTFLRLDLNFLKSAQLLGVFLGRWTAVEFGRLFGERVSTPVASQKRVHQ